MHFAFDEFVDYCLLLVAVVGVFLGIWKAATPATRKWAWLASIAFIVSLAICAQLIGLHVAAP